MTCKNCAKVLEAEETICTQCGCDNSYEPEAAERHRINPWRIAFPATASLCLLLVLGWMVFYGVMGYWIPRANDIYNQDSYTAEDDQLQASRDSVVATLGKQKLTNAQLRVFYSKVQRDYEGEFSSSKSLDQQYYDKESGLTWQQYLLETALNTWKQYRVLTDMALESGFQLPQEDQESLDSLRETLETIAGNSGYASVEALLAEDVCEGCTFEDYRYFVELNYYTNRYFDELVTEMEITQEEIEAFYEENEEDFIEVGYTKDSGKMVAIRYILVRMEQESADEVLPSDWENCETEANEILNEWLTMGATEENFSSLAQEKSDDTATQSDGGLSGYNLKNYLAAVDIRHILIMPEGGTESEDGTTVYSEAEWEACRKQAQEIYDAYLNGEQTEEAFSKLAKKYSQDSNASDGGIYTDVGKGTMVEAFDAWIFDESRMPGDHGLVKTEYGYHVMYFVHRDAAVDEWAFDEARQYGDYAVLKTDIGYQIVFYVEGDEAWIRLSREAMAWVKADELLASLSEENTINTRYYNIRVGE